MNADEHRCLKAWTGRAGIARLLYKYWLHIGEAVPTLRNSSPCAYDISAFMHVNANTHKLKTI